MDLFRKIVEERYVFARGNADHGESSSDLHQVGNDVYLDLLADDGQEHNEYSVFIKIGLVSRIVQRAEYQGEMPEDTPLRARISRVYSGLKLTLGSIDALVGEFKAWGEWREIVANEIAQEQEDCAEDSALLHEEND